MRRALILLLALAVAPGCLLAPGDGAPTLLVASTTSARDTGLLDAVEAAFENETGIAMRHVAVGSGQAMQLGRRGDADALLVHSPDAERRFVEDGHGLWRRSVMHNEFLLVGPPADPARARGLENVSTALQRIHDARATFASRGDASGTHAKETELWAAAGLNASGYAATWYKETGSGMAATLRFANEAGAYALTDDGTWTKLRAAGELSALEVTTRGDPAMRNPYSVIPVSAARHPGVDEDLAVRFAEWLTGPSGQSLIANFTVEGERLFTPAAEVA